MIGTDKVSDKLKGYLSGLQIFFAIPEWDNNGHLKSLKAPAFTKSFSNLVASTTSMSEFHKNFLILLEGIKDQYSKSNYFLIWSCTGRTLNQAVICYMLGCCFLNSTSPDMEDYHLCTLIFNFLDPPAKKTKELLDHEKNLRDTDHDSLLGKAAMRKTKVNNKAFIADHQQTIKDLCSCVGNLTLVALVIFQFNFNNRPTMPYLILRLHEVADLWTEQVRQLFVQFINIYPWMVHSELIVINYFFQIVGNNASRQRLLFPVLKEGDTIPISKLDQAEQLYMDHVLELNKVNNSRNMSLYLYKPASFDLFFPPTKRTNNSDSPSGDSKRNRNNDDAAGEGCCQNNRNGDHNNGSNDDGFISVKRGFRFVAPLEIHPRPSMWLLPKRIDLPKLS